jgi:hypothetical protein
MRTLVLCLMGRRHVCPHTRRASETGHRLSATPGCVEERRGPPGFLDRPLRTCCGRTPRRIPSPPRPLTQGLLLPSLKNSTLGIRKDLGFGAAVPRPARSHAYASQPPSLESAQGLRPARAGSPLAGQDSHLLDGRRSFMVASHPPIPSDQPCLVALFFLSVTNVGCCARRSRAGTASSLMSVLGRSMVIDSTWPRYHAAMLVMIFC